MMMVVSLTNWLYFETSLQGRNEHHHRSESLFSNFGADLMKALKDVNCAFDLDCLSNKKQSTIKYFFQTLQAL